MTDLLCEFLKILLLLGLILRIGLPAEKLKRLELLAPERVRIFLIRSHARLLLCQLVHVEA